jgi:hypothetical protein
MKFFISFAGLTENRAMSAFPAENTAIFPARTDETPFFVADDRFILIGLTPM